MELHGDPQPAVCPSESQQDKGLVLVRVIPGRDLPRHRPFEDVLDLADGSRPEGNVVQTVVAGPAASGREELKPFDQGSADLFGALKALLPNALGEPSDILRKARLIDVYGLVRPEGGIDFRLKGGVFRDPVMPDEIVRGIVGGPDHPYLRLLDDPPDAEVGIVFQFLRSQVPGLFRGLYCQRLVKAEEPLKLHAAPAVDRIAGSLLQGLDELEIPFVGRHAAGHIVFRRAIRPHQPPFIVVAEDATVRVPSPQPDLGQVVKAPVLEDLPGRDVAVVVDDGHVLRVLVEETPCGVGEEKKVFVHKSSHKTVLSVPFCPCGRARLPGSYLLPQSISRCLPMWASSRAA